MSVLAWVACFGSRALVYFSRPIEALDRDEMIATMELKFRICLQCYPTFLIEKVLVLINSLILPMQSL